MRQLKRVLALVLTIVMVLALAACSKTPATTSPDPADPSSAGGELPRTTIRIYLGGPDYSAKERVWENVSAICGDRLNADFDVVFIPWGDEYPQKLQLAISSGDNFDICFDADWWSYNTLVNKGAYLDISDLAQTYMPNYYKRLEETGNLSACYVGEGMYCIPWEAPYNPRPFFTWWDNRIDNTVTTMSEDDISTIEDVDRFLQEAKALNPDFPHIFECYGDYDIMTLLQPKYNLAKWDFHYLTFDLSKEKVTIVAEEQTDMFAECGKWAKKWVGDGVYPIDIATNNAAHTALGDKHNYAGYSMYEYIAYDDRWKDENFHYAQLYPEGLFVNKSPTNNLLAINKNAANPERALMFLDLLYSDDEVFDAVMYGIKDDTYTIDADGNYIWAEEGMDATNTSWMEWVSQWAFWRLEKMKPTPARSAEAWDMNNEFLVQDGNVNSPLAGFVPDTSKIKNEIAARDSLYSEMGFLIEYGLVDDVDAAVAEYRQKQEAIGLDKIIAEIQSQVDAYLGQ